jgi:hypothetical protein
MVQPDLEALGAVERRGGEEEGAVDVVDQTWGPDGAPPYHPFPIPMSDAMRRCWAYNQARMLLSSSAGNTADVEAHAIRIDRFIVSGTFDEIAVDGTVRWASAIGQQAMKTW